MDITLNGEKLDVKLENEKYLGEVLCGFSSWLEADGYYLKEFYVDGKLFFPVTDFSVFQQDFSMIERLELSSAVQDSLKTLHDFFQIAASAFEDARFVFLQDLFSSAEALFELLERNNISVDKLRKALSAWAYFHKNEQQSQESTEFMRSALNDILQVLVATPKQDLIDKRLALEDTLVQLQNGQMEECMHLVSDLSLLLENLLPQAEGKLAGLFVELKPFLAELANAIEETDTVAIGDLVEYEIIPLIQQIIDELD